jgi:hypothetical protein
MGLVSAKKNTLAGAFCSTELSSELNPDKILGGNQQGLSTTVVYEAEDTVTATKS